jgi:hypothetical protein
MHAAGRSLRTLAGWAKHTHPELAAALEFIHTNNCSNSNIHAGLRPVEGCCVFIETQEPSRLKSHVPARFRTLQTSVAWCDLMAWGSGGFPELGGPMGPPEHQ